MKSKRAMQQSSSEGEEPLDVTLIDALAECYNNATHWSTRRQILSIIADKVSFKTLQRWIPGLTRYRFHITMHHRLLHEDVFFVQHYNLFCSEAGFVSMGQSILLRILNVCSASVRNSLQGLDYFTAQGAKAFDDLENDKLGDDCGMGLSWAKEKMAQLKAAKRYLKGDNKVNRVNVLSAAWGIRGTYCRLRAAFSSQKW